MIFAIITHVDHIIDNDKYYGYAPYVKEMNIWSKFIDKLVIVAPVSNKKLSAIYSDYTINKIRFFKIPAISATSLFEIIRSIVFLPLIGFQIFSAMRKADHIHLRCPGNIGLMGCVAQVFFPKKPKTAKYAGNWDPNAKQPLSYRFQKWLLSNTFLTRNMQVLVYGNWPKQTKNIKSFFTATYFKSKVSEVSTREFGSEYNFLFVGSLSSGKRPLYAIQLVHALVKRGVACRLDIYGEGAERKILENYIVEHELSEFVTLLGNQSSDTIEKAYKEGHFLILPSKSEGWPKVVAEAMFWGVIPIATKISCVPWMLDFGQRGLLLNMNLNEDINMIISSIKDHDNMVSISAKGIQWSHSYTLDDFENEIKKMLQCV